jgi:hypothetical protein
VSNVGEIHRAILNLSAGEREKLEALVWPEWDGAEERCWSGFAQKLAEAEKGAFSPVAGQILSGCSKSYK